MKPLKSNHIVLTFALLSTFTTFYVAQLSTAFAQGTAFTYQGQLFDGTNLATGSYDLTFALFTDSGGVNQTGSTLTNSATPVTNGLFTVTLDFGPGIFDGTPLWLQIGAETNGGGGVFTLLNPLQPLTPAPYAVYATSADSASSAIWAGTANYATWAYNVEANAVTAAGIESGQVVKSLNSLHDAVTLSPGANISITPNGNTLTIASSGGGGVTSINGLQNAVTLSPGANVSITPSGNILTIAANSTILTGSSNAWSLTGNAGTSPTLGNFAGTTDNQPLELRVNSQRALRLEPNSSGAPNVILGSLANYIASGVAGSVIAGGGAVNYYGSPFTNSVSSDMCFLGGGEWNSIQSNAGESVLGGGYRNTIQSGSVLSVLGGGYENSIQPSATYSFLGGGYLNTNQAEATATFLGGGWQNTIQTNATVSFLGGGGFNSIQQNAYYAFLGGGYTNTVSGQYATVPGGSGNVAGGQYSFAAGDNAVAAHNGAFVWADSSGGTFSSTANNQFSVRAVGGVRLVTSGAGLSVDGALVPAFQQNAYGAPNVILGSPANFVGNVIGATIGGGGATANYAPSLSNSVTANFGTVGGGRQNTASGQDATVSGGWDNTASYYEATVSGGNQNTASGQDATVGGGFYNRATGPGAFVGGGGYDGTYGLGNIASGAATTVGGGLNNTANNSYATVGGGYGNQATASYATVPGGYNNVAGGQYSFAAGNQAQALHQGAFVWADSQNASFSSTANDQFLIRAQGNVGINTTSPESELSVVRSVAGGRGAELSLANLATSTVGNEVAINFGTEPSTYNADSPNAQIKTRLVNAGNNASDLIFSTYNGSSFGERMRIQNGGNVGIGTNNPTQALEVNGNFVLIDGASVAGLAPLTPTSAATARAIALISAV